MDEAISLPVAADEMDRLPASCTREAAVAAVKAGLPKCERNDPQMTEFLARAHDILCRKLPREIEPKYVIDEARGIRPARTRPLDSGLAEGSGELEREAGSLEVPLLDAATLWEDAKGITSDARAEQFLAEQGLLEALDRDLVRFNTGELADPWLRKLAALGYRLLLPLRNSDGDVGSLMLLAAAPLERTELCLMGVPTDGLAVGEPAKTASRSKPVAFASNALDALALMLAGKSALASPAQSRLKSLGSFAGDVRGREMYLIRTCNEEADVASAMTSLEAGLRKGGAIIKRLSPSEEYGSVAGMLREAGVGAVRAFIESASETPKPEKTKKLLRVVSGGAAAGRNLTDLGNAERLVDRHGPDLHYVHSASAWHVWSGKHWQRDVSGEVMRRMKETCRAIGFEAAAAEDSKQKEEIEEHAHRSEGASRLISAVSLASNELGIPIDANEFDADAWLLNVDNGIVDLRTGALLPHDRALLQAKVSRVAFDPAAQCPQWLKFLDTVCAGNVAVIAYLQRFVGYCLTGSAREHVLHIFWGTGRNGKGTFRNVVAELLGEYFHESPAEMWLETRQVNVGPRPDLIALRGRRLVASSEFKEGQRLDEALVKRLTGEDPISARELYGEQTTFKPVAKFILLTNPKPALRDLDEGIRSRLRFVPFTYFIKPEERDPNLKDKLVSELPGILNWALAGLAAYRDDGLDPPPDIVAATNDYVGEQDAVGRFLADRAVVVLGEDKSVPASVLYEAFKRWCDGEGVSWMPMNAFGRRLTALHFLGSTNGTNRLRRGIGLTQLTHPDASKIFNASADEGGYSGGYAND